jgi:hypothetical protein
MAEVRTRDEAIASVDVALQRWATDVTGLLAQAQSSASVASDGAQAVVRKCANQVAAIQALMAAASDDRRGELQAQLARAKDAHERASRAGERVRDVEARVAALTRTLSRVTTSQVAEARAQLGAMARALDGYRSGGIAFGGGSRQGGTGTRSGDGGGALARSCLTDLDVGLADLDENPVLDDARAQGTFGKGGLSRADYRWAVQTWNDVVGPGVAAGKSRESFVERDTQSSAVPLRRTADVYDMFLGSERIRVDRRPDGSLNIINGRHRLQIAQELGIKTLPGQVSD